MVKVSWRLRPLIAQSLLQFHLVMSYVASFIFIQGRNGVTFVSPTKEHRGWVGFIIVKIMFYRSLI